MLSPYLADFYLDLTNPLFESALALVHTRYSTNTTSNWNRAQPLRTLAHNGEINTIQGNENWMKARESTLDSPYWPDGLESVASDCQSEQVATLPGWIMSLNFWYALVVIFTMRLSMMIPEAWENLVDIHPERHAFYRYHAALMEPWDGPAAIMFTDGLRVGATLDRNGLRPMRYLTTSNDLVIATSETGAVTIDEALITTKGKLGTWPDGIG
jgi:glutamate synthase domain-containing protein 1